MSPPILCIYHGNCLDGFGAAWSIAQAMDGVEFVAGIHNQAPPETHDRHVILVDFCYKPDILEEMLKKAKSVTILDHHVSAQREVNDWLQTQTMQLTHRDLSDTPNSCWDLLEPSLRMTHGPQLTQQFDMSRSGAMIAWDFFHPTVPAPELLKHIQDKDLWQFKLNKTKEIHAALSSYPYDLEQWDRLMKKDPRELIDQGEAILRKIYKDIKELLPICQRTMQIAEYNVPVASLPYTLASEAGHIMAKGQPFAACYYDTPESRIFSLRSEETGCDVAKIAILYGGGGHKHAAGFSVPRDHILAKG